MECVSYSYKFRLYPNESQKRLLAKHFGCSRFIYNHFLRKGTDDYKEASKTGFSGYKHIKKITPLKGELEWLKEVSNQSLQQSVLNLETAYREFFRRVKKGDAKKGFPKFKNKHSKQSFKVVADIKVCGNRIKIPKFNRDGGIRFVQDREIEGKIKSAAVSKNKSGQYFVSLTVEREIEKLPKISGKLGIDLNVENIVFSDGTKIQNPLPATKLFKRRQFLAKRVGRRKLGSKRRAKTQLQLNKLTQRCTNIREDFQHKLTSKIISENQVIMVEDLNVQRMLEKDFGVKKMNRAMHRKIKDSAFGSLLHKLEYKAEWYGRELIKVDRFYASSKTCSECGEITEIGQKKKWECGCGVTHDRDVNAAINIKNWNPKN